MSSTFRTGRPISSCEPGGHRVQPERGVGGRVAGGTAQVADQDQAAAAVEDRVQGRQGAPDPAVVGDAAVGRLRHVEIDADQDLLAGHVDVAERLFGHGHLPARWTGRPTMSPAQDTSPSAFRYRSRRMCAGPSFRRDPSLVISSAVRLE